MCPSVCVCVKERERERELDSHGNPQHVDDACCLPVCRSIDSVEVHSTNVEVYVHVYNNAFPHKVIMYVYSCVFMYTYTKTQKHQGTKEYTYIRVPVYM